MKRILLMSIAVFATLSILASKEGAQHISKRTGKAVTPTEMKRTENCKQDLLDCLVNADAMEGEEKDAQIDYCAEQYKRCIQRSPSPRFIPEKFGK